MQIFSSFVANPFVHSDFQYNWCPFQAREAQQVLLIFCTTVCCDCPLSKGLPGPFLWTPFLMPWCYNGFKGLTLLERNCILWSSALCWNSYKRARTISENIKEYHNSSTQIPGSRVFSNTRNQVTANSVNVEYVFQINQENAWSPCLEIFSKWALSSVRDYRDVILSIRRATGLCHFSRPFLVSDLLSNLKCAEGVSFKHWVYIRNVLAQWPPRRLRSPLY